MKTRADIYGKDVAETVRLITTYHRIHKDQLLRLFPTKEGKIENLLSVLSKEGRIQYEPEAEVYHDGTKESLGCAMRSAIWVLADFIEKVDYHSSADFPSTLIFFAEGELYDVIYVEPDKEALIEHALAMTERDAEKRIVIVETSEQIGRLSIPDVTAFCTVDIQTGTVQYFKHDKED